MPPISEFGLSRRRAAFTHVLLSLLLLSILVVCLWFSGYAWPLWYLQGGDTLFALVAFVDVCLGPCVTLIVSNPRKPRCELIRDWSVIAVVQLIALAYGANTLWEGRPVVLVIAVDRVEVVTANMLSPERLREAEKRCVRDAERYFPKWATCWAVAKIPDDKKKQEQMLFSAIGGGADLSALPENYIPLQQGEALIEEALMSIPEALHAFPVMAPPLKMSVAFTKIPDGELGALWVAGRAKSALLLVRRNSGAYLDYVIE